MTKEAGRIAALWLPNAVLVATILGPFRVDVRMTYPACFMANVAAALLTGDTVPMSAALAASNTIECLIVVAIMRSLNSTRPDVTRPSDLLRFMFAGGIAAPAVSASLAAIAFSLQTGMLDPAVWRTWYLADALGMAIAAPILLVLLDARQQGSTPHPSWREAGLILALVTVVCVFLFSQNRFPFLFIAAPVVLLAAFRLGAIGAALAVIIVGLVSGSATMLDSGPITLVRGDIHDKLIVLQLFLGASFLSALPVAAAITEQKRTADSLRESEALRASITDNIREVVFRTDEHGRWTFLNPEWERLTGHPILLSLGRPVGELIVVEDRERANVELSALMGNDRGELQTCFRFARADGEVRWVEALIRRFVDGRAEPIGTIGSIRDVTDRVENTLALEARERELRLLADNSSDMIVRIGLDGIRRYVSPACRQLLGYDPEELVGATPIAAIHADDRARVERVCRGLLSESSDRICSYRQMRKDGNYTWLEAAYQLVRDADDQPVEFIATVRDVSQRQQAERRAAEAAARLEESHRLLTMAGAIAQIGHWRVDLVSNLATLSDEAARILELPPGTQPMPEDGAKGYIVEDRPRVRQALSRAAAGEPFEYEARVSLASGGERTVFAEGHPERAPDGSIVGIFGVIQDVTERVGAQAALARSEESHRLLAENASDVVLRTGVDGSVTYVSPSCRDVSGYLPEELVGRPSAEFIHPEELPVVHAAHVAIITGAQDSVTVEYRLKHKDGEWRWLESHMKGWRGPEGLKGGVISAIRDIGRRKQMEAELVAARDAAEDAARAKASFLANMSHEIRTPMNGVLGFTELLLNSDLGPDQRRYAELIDESGRSMMTLLNDILDFSKIEAGHLEIVREPFDVAHAISSCVRFATAQAESKRVELTVDVTPELRWVVGDKHRLKQVLVNLLSNAVKFTDHGSIRVQATQAEVDGSTIITVEDSGCGIPEDRRGSIFDSFVQADASISRRYGGTGLGLAISRKLARLMGGDLMLDSSRMGGTRMVLTLPLLATAPQPSVRKLTIHSPPASRKNGRILVAEDVEINQALVTALLGAEGYDVLLARNGAEAVRTFQEHLGSGEAIDLVLMDMQMPEVDGLEATRLIRQSGEPGADIPIIALTANAFSRDLEACRAAGMNDALSKPIDQQLLFAAIERHLGQRIAKTPAAEDPAVAMLRSRYEAFREQTLQELEVLISRSGRNDTRAQIATLCHKLAGSAGTFGDDQVGELARLVEQRAASECDTAALHDDARALTNAIKRAA